MFELTSADFPLIAVGPSVYCKRQSSPIFTANTDELAAELAQRLNRDDQAFPTDQ